MEGALVHVGHCEGGQFECRTGKCTSHGVAGKLVPSHTRQPMNVLMWPQTVAYSKGTQLVAGIVTVR